MKNSFRTTENTISSYSEQGSNAYEDPLNKNFLYGNITVDFIKSITLRPTDQVVLDIGSGTGFIFDELHKTFKSKGIKAIGVEPALGMREISVEKYRNEENFSFIDGSFENILLENKSVDRIVSTLALHWVRSLGDAAKEMRRVLKDDGCIDILMIARDDGAEFKKHIVDALKKHLTFSQIMKTALLVQRVREKEIKKHFAPVFNGFEIHVQEFKNIIYGSFDEHMKWWKARSSPVIAEVKDKEGFMVHLQEELEKAKTEKGIPFDLAYLWINIKG
jgi:ubiquinone/menaquinone biosynthesis C-methylase UbiE